MRKNLFKVIATLLICVSIAIIISSLLTTFVLSDSEKAASFLKAEGKDIKLNPKLPIKIYKGIVSATKYPL